MTKKAFVLAVPTPFATTALARVAAIRRVVAISAALGLPKTPSESDVVRVGGGIHVPVASLSRWTWWCRPRRIDSGPLAGSMVFFLDVDRPAIAALNNVPLQVPATYNGFAVPGGAGTVTINFATSVTITSQHDSVEEEPGA